MSFWEDHIYNALKESQNAGFAQCNICMLSHELSDDATYETLRKMADPSLPDDERAILAKTVWLYGLTGNHTNAAARRLYLQGYKAFARFDCVVIRCLKKKDYRLGIQVMMGFFDHFVVPRIIYFFLFAVLSLSQQAE